MLLQQQQELGLVPVDWGMVHQPLMASSGATTSCVLLMYLTATADKFDKVDAAAEQCPLSTRYVNSFFPHGVLKARQATWRICALCPLLMPLLRRACEGCDGHVW